MTDRHTVNTITSDQLDALYYRLDAARDATALHRQGLLSTAELYAVVEARPPHGEPRPACPDPIECGHEAAIGQAEDAARRALEQRQEMAAERYTWQERDDHAEADVQRVIDLYDRWVKAGPPPLGTSMARWWDRRLVELHNAIHPKEQRP